MPMPQGDAGAPANCSTMRNTIEMHPRVKRSKVRRRVRSGGPRSSPSLARGQQHHAARAEAWDEQR